MEYLAEQLRGFRDGTGKVSSAEPLTMEKLKKALEIENETRKELMQVFPAAARHYYPGRAHQPSLPDDGDASSDRDRQEFLDLIAFFMVEDIQSYPEFDGKKILWVHLLPFLPGEPSENILMKMKNIRSSPAILSSTRVEELDASRPVPRPGTEDHPQSVQRFLFPQGRDGRDIWRMTLHPDAVIQFCHWGCKQSSGGSILLKEANAGEGHPHADPGRGRNRQAQQP